MRILHLETGRHLYGGALQVLYLVRGLLARGIESKLLLPSDSEVVRTAETWGLPVETMRFGGEADVFGASRILGAVRRHRPDLLHIHSRRGADTWGSAAAVVLGVPAVATRRVDNPEPAWQIRAKLGRLAHVIAISGAIEAMLRDWGLTRVTRVHSAVDPDEWSKPRERASVFAEFGLPPEGIAGAVVAQLIERKGHAVLLRALESLGTGTAPPSFVLFGRGPLRAHLESEAERRGVAGSLRFAGFRDDLPDLLGAFDFLVHPALMEGLGVAALQAGAAGLPVIGTTAGGIPEVVMDGETGRLVSPGDSKNLAVTIAALAADPAMRHTMGARARLHIQGRFSIDAMVEGNLQVYRQVLG